MKNLILVIILFALCCQVTGQSNLRSQHELYSHRVTSPELTTFSFYDVIQHGNWDGNRVIDYDSLNMTYLGNWPFGQSFSMGYSGIGDIIFVGAGAGVLVMDASDPANPQEIATIRARALVDAMYYDAFAARIYLAAYFSGIEIWDVAGFENPQRLARIPTPGLPRGGVFSFGNHVAAITVADGVHIYNISDLANIYEEGVCLTGSQFVWNSAMWGNYIFCAAGNGGCKVVDVTDPANPVIAASVSGITTGVCVADNRLYVVSYNYGLKIYDISNLSNITLLGQLQIQGTPYRIAVKDGYAFISNATGNPGGGMQIVDVSDPAVPVQVFAYSGYAEYIAAGESVVSIVGGVDGCRFFDISDIGNPVLASAYELPVMVGDIFVQGDLAYTGTNGFRVFDVSDKSNPIQIGYHETAGDIAAVSGNLAVFIPNSMGANNPVNIMDITDPSNPFKRGHYMAPVMTNDLDLVGHYAFVACWWDGFRVVDFSNPDNPVLASHKFGWVNSNSVPGVDFCYVQALDTYGNYLYLIDYLPFPDEDTKGLYIFDITDPVNPLFVSRYRDLTSSGYDIEVQGNYAYVADQNGGLEVIDVSDPALPFTAGYVYLPDVAESVDVEGNYAYVANYIIGGVEVVDISDPVNPFIAGYYKPSGCFGLGVTIEGSYTYLADGPAGFQIHENLIITGTEDHKKPEAAGLTVYPNPASRMVTISFSLETASIMKLYITDLGGRVVKQLSSGYESAGQQSVQWDCTNGNGIRVPEGIYLVKMFSGDQAATCKVVVID